MLTSLLMVAEAVTLGTAVVVFLTALGLGVTDIAVPAGGFQVLLAPAIGLAVLALGFQWLTFFVPPHAAAILTMVALGPVTLMAFWRRRRALLERWRDVLGASAAILVFFLALVQIDIQRGFFTLGGFPSDNVFIYVQAAQFLIDHPMPSVLHAAALSNPGVGYLITTGHALPNSVGPVDAAMSVLSGWPVYAVFDLINGVALAITVGPVWFFVRHGLGGSLITAAAAACLLATNQLVYWMIGMGFQQEALAIPIFTAGLGVAVHTARAPSIRSGAVLGVIWAALVGLYLPIAGLLLVCAVACAVVAVLTGPSKTLFALLRPAAAAAAAGAVAGAAALYVLEFEGGLGIWLQVVALKTPAGGVSRFPLLPYLLGAVPFAHAWEPGPQPFTLLDKIALPLYILASVLILALLVLGQARAALRRRAVEAAVLAAGMLFVGYEAAVVGYPYGLVKAIGYLAPLTSVFIAFGGIGIDELGPPRWARRARTAGAAAIAIVLVASALASGDMVRLWVDNPALPSFPQRYIAFSELAAKVPAGTGVLVDYPTDDYLTLVKVAAIVYFLPDRNVRVYVGDIRLGTFPDQDARPAPCAYDYVISTAQPGADFALVYTDQDAVLGVYQRLGPRCAPG